MNISKRNIFIIYLLLYLSLLAGFYFNEDFASGYLYDYHIHSKYVFLFESNFLKTFLNFDKETTSHSPVYYIFFLFLKKISISEDMTRLINLHISLLIPYFFYKCLNLKYNFNLKNIKILIPCLIFLSPYFRSSSIWLGNENLSLLLLLISFYFFLKYESDREKNFSNILLNVLFLAFAAYFRPIYSFFSLYFFLRFYLDLKFSNKLAYYILTNILLSFPAIYYVFILDVNFIASHFGEKANIANFVNQASITVSIIFFYSIPFLITNLNHSFKFSLIRTKNILLSLVFLFLVIKYFNYDLNYGGGIFYKTSLILFKNNYLFYFFSFLAFNILLTTISFNLRKKDQISDIIIFLVLILLESDKIFYHETYDPLLYFIFFLLIKSKFYVNFLEKFSINRFAILTMFSFSFLIFSISKSMI